MEQNKTDKTVGAQPDKSALPLLIAINVHRLCGDEHGYEASTRRLKNKRGRYFVAADDSWLSALRTLADIIADEFGTNPEDVFERFEADYTERCCYE